MSTSSVLQTNDVIAHLGQLIISLVKDTDLMNRDEGNYELPHVYDEVISIEQIDV